LVEVEGLCACYCRSFAAEEAFPAIYRPSLGWLKGYRSVPSALRTGSHGFGFRESGPLRALALGFTVFTTLGLVLKVLIVEEVLLSRCEYKFRIAVHTLEDSILKLRHDLSAP